MTFVIFKVCLSTVDRRSPDRFYDSQAQISALVDKFKVEGHEFRKYIPNGTSNIPVNLPLTAYGSPSTCKIMFSLIGRQFCSVFTLKRFFIKILALPLFFLFLYLFILPKLEIQQQTFQTKSGLIFNALAAITFITPAITSYNCKKEKTFVILLTNLFFSCFTSKSFL